MTFDDDHCVFRSPEFPDGEMTARCSKIGVTWPPPAIIDFEDAPGMKNPRFVQVTRSQITDLERMSPECRHRRGALYEPASYPNVRH
jgi:hypothetical protein